MSNTLPFKRDWLHEAYKIFRGDTNIKVKKEHVIAAIENIIEIQKSTEELRRLMKMAYEQMAIGRLKAGLEPPPMPECLKGSKNAER
jgi:hypothetical protein